MMMMHVPKMEDTESEPISKNQVTSKVHMLNLNQFEKPHIPVFTLVWSKNEFWPKMMDDADGSHR